jgi:hypothetical protein
LKTGPRERFCPKVNFRTIQRERAGAPKSTSA